MIKVLHVIHTLSKNSGITTMLINYYSHMDPAEFTFDFALFADNNNSGQEIFENNGGHVYPCTFPNLSGYKKFIKELTQLINTNKYDIVHLHSPNIHSFVKKAIKKSNVHPKLVVHSHGSKLSDKKLNAIRNRFMVMGITKNAQLCLACSDIAGKCLYGNKPYELLVNGIDPKTFAFDPKWRKTLREQYQITDDELVVIHSGRFNEQKNHTKLVEIFYNMTKSCKCRLVLLGDGPLRQNIENLVDKLGLNDKVVFVGFTNNVVQYLSMADVFVLPSLFEGLALTLVEAQANGLPCYVSDTCSAQSKISDKLYFLPLKDSGEKWSQFILSNCRNLDRKNCDIDPSYDINNCCKKLVQLYRGLIK